MNFEGDTNIHTKALFKQCFLTDPHFTMIIFWLSILQHLYIVRNLLLKLKFLRYFTLCLIYYFFKYVFLN